VNRRIDDLAQRVSRLEGWFDEMRTWATDLVNAVVRWPAA
jgi:hypothetical protein